MTKLSAIGLLLFFCISCTGPAKHIPLTGKAKKDSIEASLLQLDSISGAKQNQHFRQHLSDTSADGFYIHNTDDLKYILDTLGLRASYEDALWRIYCIRCDKIVPISKELKDTGLPQSCLPDSLTYGELHLELQSVERERQGKLPWQLHLSDAVSPVFKLSFSFGFRNQSCPFVFAHEGCCDHSDYTVELFYSYLFKTRPVGAATASTFVTDLSDNWFNPEAKPFISRVRIYNPMQPEVIAYIRANSSKIDKWFVHKSEQEGVFDILKYPRSRIKALVRQNKNSKQKTFFFE